MATEPGEAGDGTTTEEAVVVILLLVLVVGVIGGLLAWSSGRSRSRRREDEARRRHMAAISSRTRWVIDQGVPGLLGTTDPTVLQANWTTLNATVLELQQELNSAASTAHGDASRALANLGNAMAGMRGALDGGYTVRLQHPDDAELISATDRSILAQRDHLQQAVFAFEAATV